jgi:phosphatidylethanolamine N-methyltransferase
MVSNLLNPKQKKSIFDWITLGTMAIEIVLFFVLPVWAKRALFLFIFFFWRLAYNAGLGALLKYQSDNRGLVRLAKKYQLFDREANPSAYHWLQHQLSINMGDDYDFAVSLTDNDSYQYVTDMVSTL